MKSILFAAPRSGSGKTLVTCGFLQAVIDRGFRPAAFKCGPDYIDPMFHQYVLGVDGGNLDSFFSDKQEIRQLFSSRCMEIGADLAVVEGVMGYYDGMGAISTKASTWEISVMVGAPTVLVVDCKGASVSLAPLIKGFSEFVKNSQIRGVILNRLSPMLYERLKPVVEQAGVKVYGYLPEMLDCKIESRHLGLLLPKEVEGLREKIKRLAEQMEKSLDMEGLLQLAGEAENDWEPVACKKEAQTQTCSVTIGVAKDEAFCFYYQENLKLMERLGAKLVFFSPLKDNELPEADGYLFGGGYPENFAKELSRNHSMLEAVREADRQGIPILAECGGFLYLHESLEGADGYTYEMAGLLHASAFRTNHLSRFGYLTLSEPGGEKIRGHEFHYWDTSLEGGNWTAQKPMSDRQWSCMAERGSLLCGFPHLYYPSNEGWIRKWLLKAKIRSEKSRGRGFGYSE